MNKREYAEYLAHPEWASKKEKLFRILGRKCSRSGCGISTSLQIHHKTYMLGKLPWEYSPENFEVLCRKHHCEAHAIYYVENKCWDCGKVIPESFEMCIPCKNKAAREQALDIEQVKGDLERLKVKVVTVEGGQSQTSSNKNKEQALDIQQVKGDLERLNATFTKSRLFLGFVVILTCFLAMVFWPQRKTTSFVRPNYRPATRTEVASI